MEETYTIKWPQKVILTIGDHSLTIKRKGFMSANSHGFKGDKTIPFKNITAIQLKEPKMTNGYIQFSLIGGNESTQGLFASTSDENTIMVSKKEDYEKMVELKDYIENYNYERENTSSTSVSGADEILKYKQLLDQDIITQEEFNAKKKEILGI